MDHACDRCGEDTSEANLVEVDDEMWCVECDNLRQYGYWILEDAVLAFTAASDGNS